MQVSYYNECLAAWEPLLEPVMVEDEKTMWEVQLKVNAYSHSNYQLTIYTPRLPEINGQKWSL